MKIKKPNIIQKLDNGIIGKILLGTSGALALDQMIAHHNDTKPMVPAVLTPLTAILGGTLLLSDKIDRNYAQNLVNTSIAEDTYCILDDQFGDDDYDLDDDLIYNEDDDDDLPELIDTHSRKGDNFRMEGRPIIENRAPGKSFWMDIEIDDDTPAPSSFVGTTEEWNHIAEDWKKYFVMLQRIQDNARNNTAESAEDDSEIKSEEIHEDPNTFEEETTEEPSPLEQFNNLVDAVNKETSEEN